MGDIIDGRRDPSDLRPYEGNANQHPQHQIDKLKEGIRRYGFTSPILVDEDGMVLAGHARLTAALSLQMDEVPVRIMRGLSHAEKRAYVLMDNRIQDDATLDEEQVQKELQALALELENDLAELGDLTGFDEDELTDFIGGGGGGEEPPDGVGPGGGGGDNEKVIAYQIIFDNEEQQARWYTFVRHLRKTYDGETIAERLDAFLQDTPLEDE